MSLGASACATKVLLRGSWERRQLTDVDPGKVGKRKGAVAVGRHMRGVAGLGKGLFKILRGFAIVLDEKNLHRILVVQTDRIDTYLDLPGSRRNSRHRAQSEILE